MEALVEIMEQVGNAPFDIKSYPKYIKLCQEQDSAPLDVSNGDKDEDAEESSGNGGPLTAEARGMMVNAMAATADVWLPLLRYKTETLDALKNEEEARELLNLFQSARGDYLSIPVLRFQTKTILDLNEQFRELPSEEVAHEIWSDENVREVLEEIAAAAASHLSKSHEVWEPWIHWELERLEELAALAETDPMKLVEKEQAAIRIDEMFIARLKQPHSNYTVTSDLYSPFVSSHFPPELYESKLVTSTKARELPIKQLSWREGQPKRVREQLELRANSGSSLEWKQYLNWELKAKKPQRKFISAVYERALECAARERWGALVQLVDEESEATKEAVRVKQAALAQLWEDYLNHEAHGPAQDRTALLKLARRATRSLPESGAVWAFYMRAVEKATTPAEGVEPIEWEETIDVIYLRMLEMKLIQSSLDEYILVVLTRASWSRRRCFIEEDGETVVDEERMKDVIQVLQDGIATVRTLEGGDPKMRLEGFLSTFYQTLPLIDEAIEVFQSAAKFYKTSYLAWLNYVDLLISEKNVVEARRVFKDASQRKGLDWPEVIWECWMSFEYQFGSLEDIEKASNAVKEFRKKEEERKAKAWQAHTAYYSTLAAAPVVDQIQPAAAVGHPVAHNGLASNGMEVDTTEMVAETTVPDRPLKRKRSEAIEVGSPSPKKAKHEEVPIKQEQAASPAPATTTTDAATLKRDRERTTVLVSNLPEAATEDDVKKLFKDCGEIREVLIKKLPNELVATVEFMDRDSIPTALTRDKKRVHGAEVAVSVGWKSTLFVTNFQEEMDDTKMRALFEKYGTVLDIRWPSKRIKTTRRFCYVQFTTTSAAEDALYLDGFEMEPGMKMSVLISDPTRKKDRSDAGARELRVTGVVKTVTKADLEKLFTPYGSLKDVRLLPALGNNQTAFVEFETEEAAQSGLAVNNHMLKGRRLAVTMADSRPNRVGFAPGARQETLSRSIRIKQLPTGTQEAILQQALEKIAPVSKVHLFPQENEAVAEFTNVADAGRILLEHPTLDFNGTTITLTEEERPSAIASRGRGRGRGRSRGLIGVSASRLTDEGQSRSGDRGKGRGDRGRGAPKLGLGMKATAGRDDTADRQPTEPSSGAAPSNKAPKNQADFRKMFGI